MNERVTMPIKECDNCLLCWQCEKINLKLGLCENNTYFLKKTILDDQSFTKEIGGGN